MKDLLKIIFKYVRKYWFIALLAPLFMILEVFCDMLLSQYMEKVIDFGIQTNNLANIRHYGLIMLGIVLLGVLCGVLSGVFTNLTSYKAVNDLRKDLFNKTMDLSYHQTDKFSTGSLAVRVTNDVNRVQEMINISLRMLVRQIGMFVLGVIFTLNINRKFGYLLLIILPIELLVMLIFLKKGTPYFSIMQTKIDNVNTVVHENLTGARVVKAFSKEEHESKRFKRANDDYANTMLKVSKMMALLMPLLMVAIYFGQMAIYSFGGNSIFSAFNNNMAQPEIMVGQVNQAITYIMMICMSLMMFGMLIIFIVRAMASSKRINEVLKTQNEINDGNLDTNLISDDKKGTLVFDNVCFKYPDTNANVLDSINLDIKQGETICIVGGTGCGKSSLVNLITRFYDVSGGRILLDGYDIRDYKQVDLRNRVSICLQKSELFAGTIKENVLWGKADASDEEVLKAIEISQSKEFVDSKENGLDEWVEEKGTSLSGGQKQRLSIARAIIKQPEILIFDDSTSALDLVTEAKLYKAMRENLKHITKIVVAQRIATAQNADRIVVLDQGKIIAFDTHEKLMENCPLYKDIYESQLKEGGIVDE